MIAITMGTHNHLNFDLRRAYVRPKAVAEWPNLTLKGENCPWIEDGILRVAQITGATTANSQMPRRYPIPAYRFPSG